ncbi:MAG: cofactor-independent phosphoglycerate mutase [Saccharofermentanales bacterium]|nr:cofactor-independent phosphoglycerate mutase [Clostridiaceae bacterium]
MKHIIILGDGMSDLPIAALDGKTPLQAAVKPHMDRLAREGFAGLVQTIPEGMTPGSDTANMSVMGFDPRIYYTGRSPLEAISMSIEMEPEDVAFRCNLVTLSEGAEYADRVMVDYSSDEIGSDEAARLIEEINRHFESQAFRYYPGKSYRHCLIWKKGHTKMSLVPPHDILTRVIGQYLPSGPDSAQLLSMMVQSTSILDKHPVNQARHRRKLNKANSIWIWGQGTKPQLPEISTSFALSGSVISAVDLINGLGICAGLHVVDVPGVTGNIHTNFDGKAQAAINELSRGRDYVYLHVEAPDECGHRAEIANKVRSIELIDHHIVGPVRAWLEQHRQKTGEDFRILVLPDHATPLDLRTHTADPVPFVCYSSDGREVLPALSYDEVCCQQTGYFLEEGPTLFARFVRDGFV